MYAHSSQWCKSCPVHFLLQCQLSQPWWLKELENLITVLIDSSLSINKIDHFLYKIQQTIAFDRIAWKFYCSKALGETSVWVNLQIFNIQVVTSLDLVPFTCAHSRNSYCINHWQIFIDGLLCDKPCSVYRWQNSEWKWQSPWWGQPRNK